MIRKEAVAGQFYPANAKVLEEQIKGFIKKSNSNKSVKKQKICGIIVPHAGYEFSGKAAAAAYKALKNSENADLFIVLGTNHEGMGKSVSLSLSDFSTPLGIARNDNNFCRKLEEKLKERNIDCEINENVHMHEHSIEVQLPFLLFISKDKNKNKEMKFVPILVSEDDEDKCKIIAKTIAELSIQSKKKICIIASGDFTHYGNSYGFAPFPPSKDKLYKLDKEAIDKILKLDAKSFLENAKKTTICGASVFAVCIEACKILGAKKAELLDYYTSADIIGDYSTAVGYGAIIFI